MALKISAILVFVLVVFLVYVSTRESKFYYEKSGVINAPPEKIFKYLSDFKLGELWSPYEKIDPNMKKNFIGDGKSVGSVMEFAGNREAGAGKLEFLQIIPNQLVEIELTMLEPIKARNIVKYRLVEEGAGTRFIWSMEGDGGFIGKLISVFIDCEKMVTKQFGTGIANLKNVVETQIN